MTRILLTLALFCGALAVAPALAAAPINNNGSAYAVGGYDVVAYFSDDKPVQGKPGHSSDYAGAKWLFASAEHKARFDKQPAKYVPAYQGYCAYGVSRGYLVTIDPRAFTVHQGKLYLNYSLDVRDKWLKDPDGFIKKANAHWPKLEK